jgi:hypothetical protein
VWARVPRGRRRRHAVAGLWLEFEPGTTSGKDPMGGSCLAVRERGRGSWAAGPSGEGKK